MKAGPSNKDLSPFNSNMNSETNDEKLIDLKQNGQLYILVIIFHNDCIVPLML